MVVSTAPNASLPPPRNAITTPSIRNLAASASTSSAASPFVPYQLNGSGESSAASTLTNGTDRRISRGRNRRSRGQKLIVQDIDLCDGGESDGEIEPPEFDTGKPSVFDFITNTNTLEDQNERNYTNEGPAPDFQFKDVFEFRDGTKLDMDHIPSHKPDDWEPPNDKRGNPLFHEVDNPGNWDEFVYRPYNPVGKPYAYHRMPAGATPVGKKGDGPVREINGWAVHYDGSFKVDESLDQLYRKYATVENPFPKEREGALDVEKLIRFGITKERLQNKDAMFIYQLLNPFIDPSRSGINDDTRKPYYTDVTRFTNINKSVLETPGYGHFVPPFEPYELVNFDGLLMYHSANKGDHDIHLRWDKSDCDYRPAIDDCMGYTQYLDTKRFIKWNFNAEDDAKFGTDDYDPANKFSMPYDVLIHNTGFFTKTASLDLCIDETTAGFGGHGKYVFNLRGKKVSRGIQSALLLDVGTMRLRGVLHRHKNNPKSPGFTQAGPSEVRQLLEKNVDEHVGPGKLWPMKPHITADNYFCDDKICDWIGENGYGLTATTARYNLPGKIDHKYFHKTDTSGLDSKRVRAAKFENPIVFAKQVGEGADAYQRAHFSFQSTGATNISTVNAVTSGRPYIRTKVRGRNEKHFTRVLEDNQARTIYLGTYGAVDKIDAAIKRSRLGSPYRCWKYYHTPANNAKAMTLITAYSFYLEMVSGSLFEDWYIPAKERMTPHKFQQRLGEQKMQYKPDLDIYPGDENTRLFTQQSKRKRSSEANQQRKQRRSVTVDHDTGEKIEGVSVGSFNAAVTSGRLVTSMSEFETHALSKRVLSSSTGKRKSPVDCFVCGNDTRAYCTHCTRSSNKKPIPLCFFDKKRKLDGVMQETPAMCFLKYHSPEYFGLCRDDTGVAAIDKKDWKPPSPEYERKYARYIQECFSDLYCQEVSSESSNNSSSDNNDSNSNSASSENENSNDNNKDDDNDNDSNNNNNNNNNSNNNENNGSNGSSVNNEDDVEVLEPPGGRIFAV